MRKISHIIDIDGKERNLTGIMDAYYNAITKNDTVRLSPVLKLERLKNKYRKDRARIEVIDYCINESLEYFV